jgi:hypothetical protein
MRWILDAGVFGLLARVAGNDAHWRSGALHLSEGVAHECRKGDPRAQQTALLDAEVAGGRVVDVVSLLSGGAGFLMLFGHLRRTARSATADFGEHESIAICAFERADLVFVTLDHAALALAVSELGHGRATTPYDLWADLRDSGVVTDGVFERLCSKTATHSQKLPVPWRFRRT